MSALTELARRTAPMGLYLRRRPLIPQLNPERLRLYLHTLSEHGTGQILEVGCFRGATTVEAVKHLRRLGRVLPHTIIDTFAGFPADQFDEDERLGTPSRLRADFAENPKLMVERTMRHYGFGEVHVIQADICEIPANQLPPQIAVCLMDVDLAVPIREGLEKVWPRMRPGGVILVDDCDVVTDWRGAKVGYQQFCAAYDIPERYEAGFGMLTR